MPPLSMPMRTGLWRTNTQRSSGPRIDEKGQRMSIDARVDNEALDRPLTPEEEKCAERWTKWLNEKAYDSKEHPGCRRKYGMDGRFTRRVTKKKFMGIKFTIGSVLWMCLHRKRPINGARVTTSCQNSWCIAKDHQRLTTNNGSQLGNYGRIGSLNRYAKLSESQVLAIRELRLDTQWGAGSISKSLNIPKTTVHNVLYLRQWLHIKPRSKLIRYAQDTQHPVFKNVEEHGWHHYSPSSEDHALLLTERVIHWDKLGGTKLPAPAFMLDVPGDMFGIGVCNIMVEVFPGSAKLTLFTPDVNQEPLTFERLTFGEFADMRNDPLEKEIIAFVVGMCREVSKEPKEKLAESYPAERKTSDGPVSRTPYVLIRKVSAEQVKYCKDRRSRRAQEPTRHLNTKHWRKGHIRMQPVGPKGAQHLEERYIEPTIVGPKNAKWSKKIVVVGTDSAATGRRRFEQQELPGCASNT